MHDVSPRAADAHWLDTRRLRNYPAMFLAGYAIIAVAWIASSRDLIDLKGKPLGYDFIAFWSASWLARAGRAASAYDLASIFAAHHEAVPAIESIYLWHYPPTFFVVVLPLAHLPYLVSWLVFVGATGALFWFAIRREIVDPRGRLLLAAYPAVFINVFHGQNGFLTAAILGGGLVALRRDSWRGGALLGLLALKPHLALMLPVAVLTRRDWRAALAGGAVAAVFLALSAAIMGEAVMRAFLANLPQVRGLMEDGFLPWAKMPTAFAAARMLGAPIAAAYAIQALATAASVVAVAWSWKRPGPFERRAAALVVATFFATPYCFDYDLVALAFPIAWLARDGIERGWLPGDREALAAAWLLPIIGPALALGVPVQFGPLVIGTLLFVVVRRIRRLP